MPILSGIVTCSAGLIRLIFRERTNMMIGVALVGRKYSMTASVHFLLAVNRHVSLEPQCHTHT